MSTRCDGTAKRCKSCYSASPWNLGIVNPASEHPLQIRRKSLLFLVLAELAANVGPKFLHHDGDRVVANLRAPNAGRVCQSLISVGMIAVGRDAGGKRTAENLRVV